MVAGKRELILGLIRDPQFGACVSVGIGGIFAETLQDVVFRLAPIDRAEALAMLDELKFASLLGAVRGEPPADREALAAALVALGRIGLEHPEIQEIDINPMIIAGSRPVAVDALIILKAGVSPMYANPALYINGEWLDARGRETIPVINPFNEATLGELPVATAVDLDAALSGAKSGFALWRKQTAVERAAVLHKAAGILRSRADAIAHVVTAELGAPLAAAKFEVMVASDVLDWSAGEARRIYGRLIPSRFPGHATACRERADRTGVRRVSVEHAGDLSDAKDRRGARCRLLDHHQAGRGDTGFGRRGRQGARRGRRAAWRRQSRVRRA